MSDLAPPSMKLMSRISISIWSDESMTIEGPLADPAWCVRALEAALDEVRSRVAKSRDPLGLTIPGKDVALGDCLVKP